ncbi:MAG: SDR family NAD(P)-dependent oxidoreductase, partial [Kiritimatiellaeota bacterium]|nr:SDR family NAD(P)-dependent oxidoreductase [Kiritimatiellota bacterium]
MCTACTRVWPTAWTDARAIWPWSWSTAGRAGGPDNSGALKPPHPKTGPRASRRTSEGNALMNDRLTDAVAIVTGGSKGYGAGIAEALRSAGAEVWITARNETPLIDTARRIGAHPFCADVTCPDHWDRLFEAVLARTDRLDILVNNA